MSVGTNIYDLLTNDATFAAIMGNRVFPNTVPAKTAFPFAVYTVTGTRPTNQKDGVSPLDEVMVQIDLYAKSYDLNKQAATRSREVLDRYRDNTGLDRIIFEDELDGAYDPELGVYWTSQDWRIRVNREAVGAVWFSQTFTNTTSTTLTVTANSGVLPAEDSIEVYLNGQLLTGWTKTGSAIDLPFTPETSDTIIVRFRTLADGSTVYRQTFTNVTNNSITITENSGTLPVNSAAIDVEVNGLHTTDYTIAGSVITFPYTLAGDLVTVSFRFFPSPLTAYRQTFTGVSGTVLTVTNPLPTTTAAIFIHVNGVLTTEYTRSSSTTITMQYELYASDFITITYYV